MRLLIKFPSRSRPQLFLQTLSRYREYLSGKHDVRFLCSFDLDDKTMNTPEIRAELDAMPNVVYRFGNSKTKVEAINADMDLAGDFDVLLLAADDLIPVEKEYDDAIATDMVWRFPDLDGCLWYHDGRRRDLCTIAIMGRTYYQRFGYVYNPAYRSLLCDDELQAVASAAGKLAFIDRVIILHAWTHYTGTDALYHRNFAPLNEDRKTFIKRQAAGFPVGSGV